MFWLWEDVHNFTWKNPAWNETQSLLLTMLNFLPEHFNSRAVKMFWNYNQYSTSSSWGHCNFLSRFGSLSVFWKSSKVLIHNYFTTINIFLNWFRLNAPSWKVHRARNTCDPAGKLPGLFFQKWRHYSNLTGSPQINFGDWWGYCFGLCYLALLELTWADPAD